MCAAGRLNSFEQGQRAALQWLLHSFFTTEVDERSSFNLRPWCSAASLSKQIRCSSMRN